jgi:hypothetical protein
VCSAGTWYFRLLLFFSSAVSRIAWSPNGYAILSPSDRALWRSKADVSPYCAGGVAAGAVPSGFSPVRRSWRRSWRPWRRSWRCVRRPCRRCIPCVPVAAAGGAAVPVASCASASNGSSAGDSANPNAAPSPSSESAFRRDRISVWILSFTCCLPLTHDCRTGTAAVERDHLNVGTTKAQLSRRRRVRLAF